MSKILITFAMLILLTINTNAKTIQNDVSLNKTTEVSVEDKTNNIADDFKIKSIKISISPDKQYKGIDVSYIINVQNPAYKQEKSVYMQELKEILIKSDYNLTLETETTLYLQRKFENSKHFNETFNDDLIDKFGILGRINVNISSFILNKMTLEGVTFGSTLAKKASIELLFPFGGTGKDLLKESKFSTIEWYLSNPNQMNIIHRTINVYAIIIITIIMLTLFVFARISSVPTD